MHTRKLLILALAPSVVLGCTNERHLELGQARSAIVGGVDTGAEEQAVVRVFGAPPPGSNETPRTCTGTLIAPNLVLTAMHCVAPITGDRQFGCTIDGELTDPPAGTLGTPYAADHIAVHVGPDWSTQPDARGTQILHTRTTKICTNDLALMVLDTALDAPIAPVRLDSRAEIGEPVTVVGYGLVANTPPAGTPTIRRMRADVPVLAVEQDGVQKSRPRTFALGESVCMGDSGGPAFSEQGAVLGVYSTNVAGCEGASARNFFTMLSEFRPLILDAYAAAGATPWLEGEPAPGSVVDAGPVATPEPTPDAAATVIPGEDEPPVIKEGDPEPPTPSGKRVDSGFCSASSAGPQSSAPGALVLLGGVLLGLGARRRRRAR